MKFSSPSSLHTKSGISGIGAIGLDSVDLGLGFKSVMFSTAIGAGTIGTTSAAPPA